jgi:hypothetical protein
MSHHFPRKAPDRFSEMMLAQSMTVAVVGGDKKIDSSRMAAATHPMHPASGKWFSAAARRVALRRERGAAWRRIPLFSQIRPD